MGEKEAFDIGLELVKSYIQTTRSLPPFSDMGYLSLYGAFMQATSELTNCNTSLTRTCDLSLVDSCVKEAKDRVPAVGYANEELLMNVYLSVETIMSQLVEKRTL